METDYISRDAAEKRLNRLERESYHSSVVWPDHVEECREALREIEPADVVSRDCYDRILAENDAMREMLAQIGKKPGDKMDDVRSVARARWEEATGYIFNHLAQRVYCPACKSYAYFYPITTKNYCPNCGADMRETGR